MFDTSGWIYFNPNLQDGLIVKIRTINPQTGIFESEEIELTSVALDQSSEWGPESGGAALYFSAKLFGSSTILTTLRESFVYNPGYSMEDEAAGVYEGAPIKIGHLDIYFNIIFIHRPINTVRFHREFRIRYEPWTLGGHPHYEVVEAPELTGDVNYDGVVNIVDLILTVNYIIKGSPGNLALYDINEDGGWNILDVVVLVNIILGPLE